MSKSSLKIFLVWVLASCILSAIPTTIINLINGKGDLLEDLLGNTIDVLQAGVCLFVLWLIIWNVAIILDYNSNKNSKQDKNN